MAIEDLQEKYSSELEYIKSVMLGNSDFSPDDNILLASIDRAYTAIRNYLHLEANDDLTPYFVAATTLAIVYYTNNVVVNGKAAGTRTITQKSQGSRSITYGSANIELDAQGLTADVKALLPKPKLRVF